MNKLYLLGGPPRVGKSIIMEGFLQQRPMPVISTDAVQEGVRNLFVDDPFQILRQVEFSGYAEFKKRGTKEQVRQPFSTRSNEHDLARQAVLGMLDHYERSHSDVAIEGVHINPAWVKSLTLAGFTIHAAFVGYTNPGYADAILEYAQNNEHDWINEWLAIHDGDDSGIRSWAAQQAIENRETAQKAQELGYPYFDASMQPFHEYIQTVKDYFLGQ